MRSITKYKGMRIVSLIMHSTISLLLLRLIFFFFFFAFCNYCTVVSILGTLQLFDLFDKTSSSLWSCVVQRSKGKYKNEGYPPHHLDNRLATDCGQEDESIAQNIFKIALLLYIALDFSISAIHWTFLVFIIVIQRPPPPFACHLWSSSSPMMTTNFTPFKKSREKV